MDTKILTAEVRRDLADSVDEYAARLKQSSDSIVEEALADWVRWEEEKRRMTLEGLADVDAGRVVSHAEVEAWAESLGTDNALPMPQPRSR